jgi:imidazolonepropionase-like amidohydrolase
MFKSLALIALVAAAAQAEPIYLTADKMVDVGSGRVVTRPAVVIDGDRIVAVGTQGTLAVPAGARQINLPGKTILPGLIDMHVHLTGRADVQGYGQLQVTAAVEGINGVINAGRTLQAGFTTVRNVGAGEFSDIALRDAINEGFVRGPRIFGAGISLGATGGHCDNNLLPATWSSKDETAVGDGPWALRRLVRRNDKYGADLIKICATGGVLSKGDTVGGQQLTLEEMTAIAQEAHMLGKKVAAHAHGAEGINDAIRAGIDTIEHASLANVESFRLAKEHGTWFSMDIYDDDYILGEGAKVGMLPESLEKERAIGLKQRQTFAAAHKAGVKMIFGSDAGVYPHGDNGKQFAKMVEWGMTPMEAIQAATRNAAEALGKPGDVGDISAGRYADIIAVDGDPTVNVRLLEKVPFVMKAGVVVKGE